MKKSIYIIILIYFISNLVYSQCDGDANSDLIVNVLDIVAAVGHVLGNDILIDDGFNNADTNNDNVIDVLDIVNIVSLILDGESECQDLDIPLDLSLEWEIQDDLSYFDVEALNEIMNNQIDLLTYLNGIIIIHRGEIVEEEYYSQGGIDYTFNVWSVTKSYTSTLIGQAIDQGFISSQYEILNNLLPNYGQPYLNILTLENLLTMSSGYFDSFGYPAWVYATTQQLVFMPYTQPGYFFYNNSACHLNSHVLFEGTGLTPKQFAEDNLFPFLGFENSNWISGYNNINDGSASLELRLRDMVKLGQLYLQDGHSGDNQILSSEWIQDATSFKVSTGFDGIPGYGYLWWLPPEEGYMAIGYGGQVIAVFPERNLVIGTHSDTNSTESYINLLLFYITSLIAPLFDY